eukprot:scaffold110341_cov18-Prasinocladus_malaysianus.AAC.1
MSIEATISYCLSQDYWRPFGVVYWRLQQEVQLKFGNALAIVALSLREFQLRARVRQRSGGALGVKVLLSATTGTRKYP